VTTNDEVQQTLAEYERLAITSGAKVQIDPPEFWTDTSESISLQMNMRQWSPVWSGDESPKCARATVYRDGIPTTVFVSWEESLPAVDEWRDLWLRKPMKLFGAYTLRTALRRAFRDVIGDRHEPDEIDPPAPNPDADRDWTAELAEAASISDVQKLYAEARKARVVTVELEGAFRRRLQSFADRVSDAIPGAIITVTPRAEAAVMAKPRPLPSIPTIRPEETVRRPRKGESRPQRQKPRGPRA